VSCFPEDEISGTFKAIREKMKMTTKRVEKPLSRSVGLTYGIGALTETWAKLGRIAFQSTFSIPEWIAHLRTTSM
jgi:hypothetical protein